MKFIKRSSIYRLVNGDIQVENIGFCEVVGIGVLFFLLSLVVGVIPAFIGENIIGTYINKGIFTWCWVIVNEFLINVIIISIVINIFKTKDCCNLDVNKVKINKKDYICCLGIIISFIMIKYGAIDEMLGKLPYLISDESVGKIEELYKNSPRSVLFIVGVILAPFFEEIVYRGIILNGMLKKYSPKKAIVISSLIFGFMHLNLPQGLNAFIIGLIIGTVYYFTKSLYICMLMHAANNFIANFMYVPENFTMKVAFYIIVPILGIILFLKCKNKLDFRNRLND